jgi:FkbM family methyltransferase
MSRKVTAIFSRGWRFLQRPFSEQSRLLYWRWRRLFPNMPLPVRLPFGGWWLARNDYLGRCVVEGQFESAEVAFVSRFLRPGMTVLDVGAHHGFYTLLLSKLVGPEGRVFAFEPSPRERRTLLRHVRINRCGNVNVEALALGSEEGNASLFVVQGEQTGCNSLRTPASDVPGEFIPTPVRIVRLDDWLDAQKIERVDFIKLDVEGGELEVLRGAEDLLERHPRLLILAELQDVRAEAWGQRAKDVAAFLQSFGFRWFKPMLGGNLANVPEDRDEYDDNLVAVPEERMGEIAEMIEHGPRS